MFANFKDIRRKNTGGAASGLEADRTARMCRLIRELGLGCWCIGGRSLCRPQALRELMCYVDFAVNCSVTYVSTSW